MPLKKYKHCGYIQRGLLMVNSALQSGGLQNYSGACSLLNRVAMRDLNLRDHYRNA